jgi:hypothetical protein
MMTPLLFPRTPLELKREGNQIKVKCQVRKSWLILTPEEWVRQHLIGFLVNQRKLPLGRISVEKGLTYNGKMKRWDLVTYDQEGRAEILVECKKTTVNCTHEVLFQISAYQKIVQAKKMVVTNGLECHVYQSGKWENGLDWL